MNILLITTTCIKQLLRFMSSSYASMYSPSRVLLHFDDAYMEPSLRSLTHQSERGS